MGGLVVVVDEEHELEKEATDPKQISSLPTTGN
jgi:hypothetical protein